LNIIPERLRTAKNKEKKAKRQYTKEEIHHRDKWGLRARDYFITTMVSFITFIILYYFYHWNINNTLGAVLLITIMLLLFLRRLVHAPKEEEMEGWLITWVDPTGFYNLPSNHNMRLVWGKARTLPDGSLESIPESFLMTYEKKKGEQRRFNPMLINSINYAKRLREMGETVYYTDGTDKFQSPIQAMTNKTQVLKSAGLTGKNVKNTTEWMKRRGTILED